MDCIAPSEVFLDDLDFMGNLHNGRYPLLVERALVSVWARGGYAMVDGVPTHPDVMHAVLEQTYRYLTPVRRVGPVHVEFKLTKLGRSSMVYAFRVLSTDGGTVHAEGTRVEVNIDMETLTTAPWAEQTRELAVTLFGIPTPADSAGAQERMPDRAPAT
ncbi:thioesterase family protein [Streptomyces sp. NBC_00287]|uniref:acyl-CoA thioesterase n=1 Tax=Streptomyces sp. NBC_00287 TaxID=2975702 RepID=UPI002E28CE7C|nr:thioesterase family protein [Streptomyces sp. NBC_00287]